MAGERLPARFSPRSELRFRCTGKCFETATSHMQSVRRKLKKTLPVRLNIIYLYVFNLFVMDSKLTLKLDKFVIDKAKDYASSQKRSLSRIIESYLRLLVNKNNPKETDDIEISPFVKSIASGVKITADFDYKKEYGEYLSNKYK